VITDEEFCTAIGMLPIHRRTAVLIDQQSGGCSGPSGSGLQNVELPTVKKTSAHVMLAIKVNDYVVIKMQSQKKKSPPLLYVGLVIVRESGVSWRIKCMRRNRSHTNQFVFPTVEDVDVYLDDEIVGVLQPPKVVRNIYHFSDDMSTFAGLR
jgi:hypothetical protein